MFSQCHKSRTCFSLFALLLLVVMGCKKDDLTVLDIPFEDLPASYYVLKPSTVQIPKERLSELVMGRRDNEIRVTNDPIFANLKVGDVVMSELDADRDDILFRKVVEIQDNGSQLILMTEDATLPEAMADFYFNTQKPDVFGFKNNPYNLNQLPGGILTDILGAFGLNPSFPLIITNDFALTGQIDFEIIHPHTAYKYFACNNDDQCFASIDTTDANPRNGYYDVVDQFFNFSLDQDLTRNGLYTLSINNFGIETIGGTIASKVGTGQAVNLSGISSPSALKDAIVGEVQNNFITPTAPSLDLTFYRTPISYWGLISLTIPIASILELEMDAAAFISIAQNYTNRVDIQLGHINWNSSVPSARPDIKVTRNGNPASLTDIIQNPSLDAMMAINGSMKLRAGFGIGGAISVGEANRIGTSIGALIEFPYYTRLHGGAGVRARDLLNLNNNFSIDPFGQICFDFGMEFDAFLFADVQFLGVNEYVGDLDLFEFKLEIPKDKLGLQDFSFMSLLPDYIPSNGLCFGFLGCESTTVTTLNFGLNDANDLLLAFQIDNEVLAPGTFELTLRTGEGNIKLPDEYIYGESYNLQITENPQAVLSALIAGTLKIELQGKNNGCFSIFDESSYGFYLSCDDAPFENNSFGLGVDSINLVNNTVTFFGKEEAFQHCNSLVQRLATPDIIEFELANRPCVNPTGFLIPNSGGTEWSTTDKAFIWIEDQPDGHDMMIVEFEFRAGSGSIKSFQTLKASPSMKATAICVN